MTARPPIKIATIADNPDPNWIWIGDRMDADFSISGRKLEWRGFSTAPERNAQSELGLKIARRFKGVARRRGVKRLAAAAREAPFDLIVSHGPWSAAWTERLLGGARGGARHFAFSFNFTDLPQGARKALMRRAFRTVDAFAVFTDAEQSLYADYFNIDRKKILRAPWGVAPPLTTPPPKPIEGDYYAALGGEARDYETLCETARLCPDMQFVVVTRPHNFKGLDPPANLSVLFNLPFEAAWAVVWHAKAALIPLRSRKTPCGLVTLVGGMHLGKAQIATDAVGVGEYVSEGASGLLVPPNAPDALASAIRILDENPALAARLGANAKAYAAAHCSEAATVDFFCAALGRWFG